MKPTALLWWALLLACFPFANSQADNPAFKDEALTYTVSYKWGLIQKDAATATLSLKNTHQNYDITLAAKTLPWADKIFSVRDTLASVISRADMRPVSYVKTTHEKGKYRKDVIKYSYMLNYVYGACTRYKLTDGKLTSTTKKFSATGPTYDMLSIFYYVRSLDFASLNKSQKIRATLFSGSGTEYINIQKKGIETVSVPAGKKYKCYHLVFTFTMLSGKESSIPMDVWITTDSQHIPVKFVGTLPFGQVRAFLTNVKIGS